MGLVDQSDEYLINLMEEYPPSTETYKQCKDILDMRQMERFKTAYDLQAQSAQRLVKVSWVLAIATWVLVVATILAPHIAR